MKKLMIGMLISLIAFPAIANDRYIIRDDGGGRVDEFREAIDYFKQNKIGLKVGGYCASACTLVLDKQAKLDVCVTPNASMLIHSPYAMINTPNGPQPVFLVLTAVTADKMLKEFLDIYPDWLIAYLKDKRIPSVAKGDAPNEMVEVNFFTLSQYMPVCGFERKLVETRN